MNYWLVKSEPSVFAWEKLVKEKHAVWDGVRNYAARLHLMAMQKGDEVFFYHSNEGLAIVGIAKVTRTAYQDPTTSDERWVAVDLAPVKTLKNPVPLVDIKNNKKLKNMALVRIGRLSVQPVSPTEYETILELSK